MKIQNPNLSEATIASHNNVKEKLLKKFPHCKRGFWRIRGEDTNCDMGGSHHMPELCVVESTYIEAVDLAISLSGFWYWGGGGDIEEVIVHKPMDVIQRQQLETELKTLEARVAKIKKDLYR